MSERRRVLIDWDWGASGIWCLGTAERGLLSADLLDALQAWNDDGDLFMGRRAHEHTDEDRFAFWARGRDLADEAQRQLGPDYEVLCRTPAAYSG